MGGSFERVASGGPSEALLDELDELDWASTSTEGELRRMKEARHRQKSAAGRRDNGFAIDNTIWIRRSREVYGSGGRGGNLL